MNSVFVRFSFWLGTSLTGFLPSFAFWVVLHWKAIRLALLSARVTFLWMDRVFTGFLPSSFFVWSRWPRSRFSFTSQTKKMISPRALLPFFLNVLIVGYGLVFYRVFYRVFFFMSFQSVPANEWKRKTIGGGRGEVKRSRRFRVLSLSLSLSIFPFSFLSSTQKRKGKWPSPLADRPWRRGGRQKAAPSIVSLASNSFSGPNYRVFFVCFFFLPSFARIPVVVHPAPRWKRPLPSFTEFFFPLITRRWVQRVSLISQYGVPSFTEFFFPLITHH